MSESSGAVDAVIEAEGLVKEFQGGDGGIIRVLNEVSVTVRRGEMVAVVGSSGAGKSTLLHVLGALERSSAGRIRLVGQAVAGLPAAALAALTNRTVGFVFQFNHLLREFSAVENVMIPLRVAGETVPRARVRAVALLGRGGV
ncbi:MAG: ATP-binding cassette domain-containing protein, partial [Gemmatimonas sp.]|uniref:ATP-binding cassette domain-containing protein n=1 Tax=Gemmatimonas sp. TaxID=1962908 RepID=UPI00391FB238